MIIVTYFILYIQMNDTAMCSS